MRENRSSSRGALKPIPEVSHFEIIDRIRRFRVHTFDVTQRLYERYGPISLQEFGPLPIKTIHLFGPDANRMVVLDRDGHLSSRRAWDLIMGRIFRNGLLLRDGADHRHHRRLMQPTFRKPMVQLFGEHMNPLVARALDDWRTQREGFRAFPAFKRLTLDLACALFLGIDLGADSKRLSGAFEDAVAASLSIVRLPIPGLEFNRGLKGRQTMIELFGSMIAERREGRGTDLFSQLCRAETEDGARYSDEEIIDHTIFLMMAAHDTTTSALTSLTYELARHPEWQERVREECNGLGGEVLAHEDLGKLGALDLCLQETLRRYPPLSTIPRVSLRAFEWEGYQIPEGALLSIYPLHTHHMADWWSTPFRFDPERFGDARQEHRRHTHSYLPFGGGAHMCLGRRFAELQVRVVVFQLVRRYRWRVAPGYKMPVQQAPISKPMDGLPLDLEPIV